MKCFRRVGLAVASLTLLLAAGCATVASPVNGWWYTGVKGPLEATSVGDNLKTGESSCQTVMGLIATGDASIEQAAKNGGIKKIHHVDFRSFSVLGFYAEFTTIVHGE